MGLVAVSAFPVKAPLNVVAVTPAMPVMFVELSPTMFPFAVILLVTVTVSNVGVSDTVILAVVPSPTAEIETLLPTTSSAANVNPVPTATPSSKI